VSQFKKYSDKKSLLLLRDYNRWLEANINKPTNRVSIGIYYFEEKNKE